MRKLAFLLGALTILAGCGETASAPGPAQPRTYALNWRQVEGGRHDFFVIRVRSLAVTRSGWRVRATIENHSSAVFWTVRPHVPGGTKFGLFVLKTGMLSELEKRIEHGPRLPQLSATSFSPALPRSFQPGGRWAGSFGGADTIPRGSFVRVAFGRFTTYGEAPPGLYAGMLFVTERAVKVT